MSVRLKEKVDGRNLSLQLNASCVWNVKVWIVTLSVGG